MTNLALLMEVTESSPELDESNSWLVIMTRDIPDIWQLVIRVPADMASPELDQFTDIVGDFAGQLEAQGQNWQEKEA